jgi:hypothetical protein
MNVLITHEVSGTVRDAFRKLGHEAFSCDLKPSDSPFHIQGDALAAMKSRKWDFIGMHPECRFLTVSGLHWNNRGRGWELTEKALQHVKDCMATATECSPRWYLENSISIISSRIREPDQIIQPWQFGEDASKATCLWLHNLPFLQPTNREQDLFCAPLPPARVVEGKRRYSNQTDSGQNKLAPSETRSADRAQTYPGIARAMAEQWAQFLTKNHP